MLQPSDRHHLFESLRPPEDYVLDYAIGTTFTLDLVALLTAPLAFTAFDWAYDDRLLTCSPHLLLGTMQQHADRIGIFCQTGKIALPDTKTHLLLSSLEESVIEVDASDQRGIFHPKIWLLRFIAPDYPEQSACYRLLCLSRNLAFDRSWDTILLLDGQLTGRKQPTNQPLCDFIQHLPDLAHHGKVPQRTKDAIKRILKELPRVAFELPSGFQELKFHSIGISGKTSFPIAGRIDRLLIISPFVSESSLEKFSKMGQHNVLISRPEALDPIKPEVLHRFDQLFQMNVKATPEEDESDAEERQAVLSGLHAKLYVADAGHRARIWTGSANATEAAFQHNVEFLVELVGRKSDFGIDALLDASQNSEVNFRSLLEPFTPPAIPPDSKVGDPLIKKAHDQLTKMHYHAKVIPSETAPQQYHIQLTVEAPVTLPDEIKVMCYPLGRKGVAVQLKPTSVTNSVIQFSDLSCEAITPFLTFEVYAQDSIEPVDTFVMNVPIEGVPEDRRSRILRHLLSDEKRVLRMLMFLLTETRADARKLLDIIQGDEKKNSGSHSESYVAELPLFEAMVKALNRNPARLDRIHSLVQDLREHAGEESILPDSFEQIWQPIYQVRQQLH